MSTEAAETPEAAASDAGAVPPPSDRVRVRRKPMRGHYDRQTIDAILDDAIVGTVSFVVDGQPYGTPTGVWRQGDRLYWHGSSASRMLRITDGAPVCVTVTHLDALVLARSGMNHSVDYRSVMVLGTAHLVTDPLEAEAALETFIEHLYPGRWRQLRPMSDSDRKATSVRWVSLDEASAKVRDEGAHEDEGDETWPAWGGSIPVRMVAGAAEPDPFVPAGMPAPTSRLPLER